MAAEDLGDPQLGGLEVDALDAHDDVEDRVPATLLDAGAEGPGLALVPAPGGILVRVIGIGQRDVRRAVLPGDPERAEHLRLAAADCLLESSGRRVRT